MHYVPQARAAECKAAIKNIKVYDICIVNGEGGDCVTVWNLADIFPIQSISMRGTGAPVAMKDHNFAGINS